MAPGTGCHETRADAVVFPSTATPVTDVGITMVVGAIAVTTVSGSVVTVLAVGAVNDTNAAAAVVASGYTATT